MKYQQFFYMKNENKMFFFFFFFFLKLSSAVVNGVFKGVRFLILIAFIVYCGFKFS